MAKKGGGGINIVLSADAEALKKGLAEAKAALSKTADAAVADQKRIADAATKFAKDATNAGTLRAQNRALFNLAAAYESMGEAGSKAFRQTLKQAGEAKDRMGDLQMMVEAGHMEGKVKVFAGALQSSIGIIGGVEAGMHLLGMKTEDAAKVTAKLQSLMMMSQAVGSVIALTDQVKALAATTSIAATAQKALSTAMSISPLGIAAIAVGALVVAFGDFGGKVKKLTEEQKAAQNVQTATNKLLQEEYGRTSALIALAGNEKGSRQVRQTALAELQKIYPDYLKNLNIETSSTSELKAGLDALNSAIVKRAKAQAAMNELTKISGEELAKEQEILKQQEAARKKAIDLGAIGASPDQIKKATATMDAIVAMRRTELGNLDKQKQYLLDQINKNNESAAAIKTTDAPVKATPKVKVHGIELIGMKESMQTAMDKLSEQVSFDANIVGKDFAPVGPNGISPIFGQSANQMIKQTEFILMKSQEAHDDFLRRQRSKKSFIGPAPQLAPVEIAPINLKQMQENQRQLDKLGKLEEARYNQRVAQVQAMNQGIQQALSSGTDAFEQFVTDMVAGDKMAGKNFGTALLGAVAQFMSTLGKAMIAAAVASDVFQKALLTQPAAAIVAGVALVAAAGAVKGLMKKGLGAGQGGGEGAGTGGQGIRRFADGGIISGPTVGLMGEYPGAASNPEVVAPLDKLKNLIGQSGGGGGELVTRISGQDLLIMLDRAETYRGRVR
jgi:hypothetical protein